MVSNDQIYDWLASVNDPEVPVLSILDLGVVRGVKQLENGAWEITITPTYSGCPAMQVIEDDIKANLLLNGIDNVQVVSVLSPAWTTDWLSENGRKKLKEYGIAPPVNELDKSVLFGVPTPVPCPLCDTINTKMISQFGSTACKAHYQCQECLEPFDYFKCLNKEVSIFLQSYFLRSTKLFLQRHPKKIIPLVLNQFETALLLGFYW